MNSGELHGIESAIEKLENEIEEKKKELTRLRHSLPMEEVQDYTLLGPGGAQVRLSELFGNHEEMVLIHNMGKGCAYCTLWADGFNGVLGHLENRAAFAVVSPDDPEAQRKFAESRGWRFRILSGRESTFTKDMGFATSDNKYMPGVSTFLKDKDGRLFKVASAGFGPGDDYCAIWHLFDLLHGGSETWAPKFKY